MDDSSTPLERLHAAIQEFSNSLADTTAKAGMVGQAIVVWEEASFDDDGNLHRQVLYAATGDGASPAGSLGLASLGLAQIQTDIMGRHCDHDED